MGLLDAFLIAGSGVARGYRGSQQVQRELAEAKRKALMEDEELRLKQAQASLQERLGSSTIASEGQAREAGAFTLGEQRRASLLGQGPVDPRTTGGFHGTMEQADKLSDIIRANIGEQGANTRERISNQFRVDNPNAYGGTRRSYLEPEDEALLKLGLDMQQPVPDIVALNPEKAGAFRKAQQDDLFKLLKRSPRFAKLLSDSTAVEPTKPTVPKGRRSTKGR